MRIIAVILALIISSVAIASPRGGGSLSAPPEALAAGYTVNTFSTQSKFTTGTVDMAATNVAGFQWYMWNYFSTPQSSSPVTLNADGTVTISNSNGYGGTLTSTVQTGTSPYFRGTAFGGGGYFEAELAFDAANVNISVGWPAWWTMANEHLIGDINDAWNGQASGYVHFIEADIFEYDITAGSGLYGSATHEYWGIYNTTCPGSYCTQFKLVIVTPPPVVNFSLYHKYGMLWTPATSATPGSLTYYFDDVLMGSLSYSQFTTQTPPPTGQPWSYGIIDNNHLTLILGNASAARMQIRSVNVWQATGTHNVTN
jgi:hypothetical protein